MSDPIFLLTIPVERWAPERYVPAAASEAVVLGEKLRLRGTVLDELIISGRPAVAIAPQAFRVTATFAWRQRHQNLATSLRVRVTALGADDQELAAITARASTRWHSATPLDAPADTTETFALSFGYLEPITHAARALRGALRILSVSVKVGHSDTLDKNRESVRETSLQPLMSSENASPLNPYALEGIAGEDADVWANHGYPAVEAGPWARAGFNAWDGATWAECGFTPEQAGAWTPGAFDTESGVTWALAGFAVDEAIAWHELGADPDDAGACRALGVTADDFHDGHLDSLSPADLAGLAGTMSLEDVFQWVRAISEYDLLEVIDVPVLLEAGLSPWDLARSPTNLTAGQIVRYLAGDHIEEFEGLAEYESTDDEWNTEEGRGSAHHDEEAEATEDGDPWY